MDKCIDSMCCLVIEDGDGTRTQNETAHARPATPTQMNAPRCNKSSVFCILPLEVPKAKTVTETLNDFVHYGYVALPLWVFAEQIGVPIPAAPILLAAGAIAATGRMSLPLLTALALAAALTADLFGIALGTHMVRGHLGGCAGCAWSRIPASVASRIFWKNMACVLSWSPSSYRA